MSKIKFLLVAVTFVLGASNVFCKRSTLRSASPTKKIQTTRRPKNTLEKSKINKSRRILKNTKK